MRGPINEQGTGRLVNALQVRTAQSLACAPAPFNNSLLAANIVVAFQAAFLLQLVRFISLNARAGVI